MLNNRVIATWLLIQVVPLSILYFVYTFFSEQSFFQLEGVWKGVVATGPIAAYIFITWIGFGYFKQLLSISIVNINDGIENVVGNWSFEALSEGNTNAKGSCEISNQYNQLKISGTYEEQGEITAMWQSDIAFLVGNNLYYVYKLDSHNTGYLGYVRLLVTRKSNKKAFEMKGEWVAIGQEKKHGSITIVRKAAG